MKPHDEETLRALAEFTRGFGYKPTYERLGQIMYLSAPGIHYRLKRLAKMGYVILNGVGYPPDITEKGWEWYDAHVRTMPNR